MIDAHPGFWPEWLIEELGPNVEITPQVHDRPSERISALLGPDGEPLLVPYPRNKIGFDLTPSKKGGARCPSP